jgi:hypothetical protein
VAPATRATPAQAARFIEVWPDSTWDKYARSFPLAGFWAFRRPRPAEEAPTHTPVVPEAQAASSSSGEWMSVDIEGKVSFSLPPGMKEVPPPYTGDVDRVYRRIGPTERDFLFLTYVYGKRVSCDSDADFANKEISQKSEVMIGGKKARLNIWQPERAQYSTSYSTFPEMTLCIPNLGRGKTKLHFHAVAIDLEALKAARQIFDTIEFH